MGAFNVLSAALTWPSTPVADSKITFQRATCNLSAATGKHLTSGGVTVTSPGLKSWTGTISGHLGTPAVGTSLTASIVNGYDTNVEGWTFQYNIAASTFYTDSSTSGWMDALPGAESWTASVLCKADDAEPLVAPGAAAAELVLTSSSGNTITGDAIATAVPIDVQIGQVMGVNISYEGTGTTAIAGTNNLVTAVDPLARLAASTLTIKAHEVGTTDVQYSGSAFITSLSLNATSSGLITYDLGYQGTGALTIDDPAV